jgi:hypothetical protein
MLFLRSALANKHLFMILSTCFSFLQRKAKEKQKKADARAKFEADQQKWKEKEKAKKKEAEAKKNFGGTNVGGSVKSKSEKGRLSRRPSNANQKRPGTSGDVSGMSSRRQSAIFEDVEDSGR